MRRFDFARNQDWERIPMMEPDETGDYVEYEEAAAAIRELVKERDSLRAALQRLYDADIAARDGNHGRRWQDALRAAEAALAGGRDE